MKTKRNPPIFWHEGMIRYWEMENRKWKDAGGLLHDKSIVIEDIDEYCRGGTQAEKKFIEIEKKTGAEPDYGEYEKLFYSKAVHNMGIGETSIASFYWGAYRTTKFAINRMKKVKLVTELVGNDDW